MTAHKKVDIGFDFLITFVFAVVSLLFLFPNNKYLPLDRRLAGLIGSALCTLLIWFFPQKKSNDVLNDVDVQVLLVLIAIMTINFVIMRQPMLLVSIKWMQLYIRRNPNSGFWLVSFISFIVSPFIMNDGLCLLLVTPVLDAFCFSGDDKGVPFDLEASMTAAADGASQVPKCDEEDGGSSSRDNINQHDPFYFMLAIACSANIGSATTFSGNPQNIIVAQYLSKYMNCGEFFGLMIVPAIISWLITTSLLNYYRLTATTSERASVAVDRRLENDPTPQSVDGGSVEMGALCKSRPDSSPLNEDGNWKRASRLLVLFAASSVSRYSSSVPAATDSPGDEEAADNRKGLFAFSPKSIKSSNKTHRAFVATTDGVDSPLAHKRGGDIVAEKEEDQDRLVEEEAKTGIDTSVRLSADLIDAHQHRSSSSIFSHTLNSRKHSGSGAAHDLPSTVSDRLDGALGLVPPEMQRNMEPIFEAHEPVDVSLPSGALSIVAFLFFALLIALEFVGIFSLASIFTVIAICLVGSVLLINYYRGHPVADEQGRPYSNEERIAGIAAYTEELFLDLDYNILLIFTGLFIVSGSFVHTGIPSVIWKGVAGSTPFQSAASLILISVYVSLSSQLVGNVAVVFMAKDEVSALSPHVQKFGWCVLAWVSTVAGNLMLTGSAANIIVAEKAARHKVVPVVIATDRHLRICFPVTALCIAIGVVILYLESISIM